MLELSFTKTPFKLEELNCDRFLYVVYYVMGYPYFAYQSFIGIKTDSRNMPWMQYRC